MAMKKTKLHFIITFFIFIYFFWQSYILKNNLSELIGKSDTE